MSFKFLYEEEQPKMDVSFLEEYGERIKVLEDTHSLINAGLEANIELAEHIGNEINYLLDELDTGLEDNDDKKKSKNMSTAKKIYLVLKFIAKLLQIVFKIIGIAGVNMLGLMRMKVTAYADTAEKILEKTKTYMKEHNIKEGECIKTFKEDSSRFVNKGDGVLGFLIYVSGSYKKAVDLGLEEYSNLINNMELANVLNKLFEEMDVLKDFKKMNEITSNGIVTKEIHTIIKKYTIDLYEHLVKFNIKGPSSDYVLKHADKFVISKFLQADRKIEPKNVMLTMPYGAKPDGKDNALVLSADFLIKNDEDYDLILHSEGKKLTDIHNKITPYELAKGEYDLGSAKTVEPELFKIGEIEDIIKHIKDKSPDVDKIVSIFKKIDKNARKATDEIDSVRDKVKIQKVSNMDSTDLLVSIISEVFRNYVKFSRFLTSSLGGGVGLELPIGILFNTAFAKGVCVGSIDLSAIREALKTEIDNFEKEHKNSE